MWSPKLWLGVDFRLPKPLAKDIFIPAVGKEELLVSLFIITISINVTLPVSHKEDM